MSGKTLDFLKNAQVRVSVYGLWILMATAVATSWKAAMAFSDLKRAVEKQWTYPMEKESWDKFGRMNGSLAIPDVERIRRDHVYASPHPSNSATVSQN